MRCGNSYLYILQKARLIYQSTAAVVGAVLKSKCNLIICGAGVGDAVHAAKKWWLDRACSVAGVPLGTVSAALTLHSQRCLCMWQYVEPLLVHTR